ncbi:MAG: hypothetical protein NZM43_06845 [Saprospiraceae bacterium]|nr:hypothetical protein [Saprospiraceae bacterium]MDW8484026.1 hypothetical protein [Saprospiraceae bacterium]
MTSRKGFEQIYEQWIERPSAAYRKQLGPAVNLSTEAFEAFVQRLRSYRADYPTMAFWIVLDYASLRAMLCEGDADVFGSAIRSKRELLTRIHPQYLLPYLRWRKAVYELMVVYPEKVCSPLKHVFRIWVPLRTHSGQYWWFWINSLILQLDANQRITTTLETFYRDNQWSKHNLRPVEASLYAHDPKEESLNTELAMQFSLQLAELFTDAELELLALYANGKNTREVLSARKWSLHTLHEYNTHLLRKARELFVYDFKNARHFAEYCKERRILQFKPR